MQFRTLVLTAVAVFSSTIAAKPGTGAMTWFNAGLGACGWWDNDGEAVVALNTADYNGGANCGRWITITANGRTTAGRVVDLCPGCTKNGIDASPAIFDDIAPLDEGIVTVTWWFQ
ncbi:RlpA-like double-psi beta-barrel-protein domain-containing protein-containing protein [Xylaria nigripes]|nr:RlpA-like double-psi beta-barrel-protein domain-containing protein-containing protein [Xylaria nigripes]